MNTKHFDYFIAIAETGCLTHAARRLGVSQPVLSRYVSGLEQQLGTPLFRWDGHMFRTTPAGEVYRNGIMRMKELQTQMLRSLKTLQGIETRVLRIGMSPYRGGRELASFYPDLLSRYPTLDLFITEGPASELLDKLYKKELSTIINLYDPDLMPRTNIATLIRAELLLVLPSYHPVCGGVSANMEHPLTITSQQLSSLDDVLFVCFDSSSIIGQVIRRTCLRYNFTPQTLLKTGNSIAISSLIASGSYAGFQLYNSGLNGRDVCFFHLPHPVYLHSGMIFAENHQPAEIEQYLYYLEYLQAKKDTPDILSVNETGRQILDHVTAHLTREV